MIEQKDGSSILAFDSDLTKKARRAVHRTLSEAWKDPFPVYRAWMERFERVRAQLPEDQQSTRGMKWLQRGARIDAAFKEFGAGFADIIWDTAIFPLTILEPRFRHPNFKKQLTLASIPDMVGNVDVDGSNDPLYLWVTSGGLSRFKRDRYQETSSSEDTSGGGGVDFSSEGFDVAAGAIS